MCLFIAMSQKHRAKEDSRTTSLNLLLDVALQGNRIFNTGYDGTKSFHIFLVYDIFS